jgi:aryl-alcohol dehydrogenase-like predicted oxidoreductase
MADDPCLNRRDFVRAGAAGAAVLLGATLPAHADGGDGKLPHRVLGKTGVRVPVLGMGTVALGALGDEKEAVALLHKAIDLGVTYIDTAPPRTSIAAFTGYARAQRYVNAALRERRKEVFLATKCLETDGDRALLQLGRNLQELGVDQVDLAYTHSIGHAVYDLEALAGDRGPMAALERAKKDGFTRFVGVTGHNRPEKFAQVVARRDIDAMMNACNVVDRHTYSFETVVWPLAREKGVGLVAMKVLGGSIVTRPCKMPEELRHASFRFALSVEGVATAVIGMGSVRELEQNVEWARTFKPLTAEESAELKKQTVALARKWGPHLDLLDSRGERSRPLINT